MRSEQVDVAVIGAGPAGLALAVALRRTGVSVTVIEREAAGGGIARDSNHTGYGLQEFHRLLRGPAYAQRWVDRALRAGVDLRTRTTATGWTDGGASQRTLTLTSASGTAALAARCVVLATGTRERPRSARLVPGDRPSGVFTTGAVQRLAARGLLTGRRAVVIGAEHVSFSAVLTLAHAGIATVALVTSERRHQTTAAIRAGVALRYRVPVLTSTSCSRIIGRARVESVELIDLEGGTRRVVECDTVVFSGDWVPEHELARRGGIDIDPGTRAPRVDPGLRTAIPGIVVAGNILHGAETAAVCARSGEWAAMAVSEWLAHEDPTRWRATAGIPIECEAPLQWVSPNVVVPGDRDVAHGHFLARSREFARRPQITVRQGARELWSGRIGRTTPTRPVHLPTGWMRHVRGEEPIRIGVPG